MPETTDQLMNDARCIDKCIPDGMKLAVLISIFQQLLTNGTGGGGGSGSVSSFSSGNLSPLFTTSVVTPTTTPALSFSAVSQNANLFYVSPDGVAGNPTFRALVNGDFGTTLTPQFAQVFVGGGSFVASSAVQITKNTNDFTNTGAANTHLLINNPNAAGQSSLMFVTNSVLVGKMRVDSSGNVVISSLTVSGSIFLQTNGDSAGNLILKLDGSSHLANATNGFAVGGTAGTTATYTVGVNTSITFVGGIATAVV